MSYYFLRKKRRLGFVLVFICLLISLFYGTFISYYGLTVTEYTMNSEKISTAIDVAVISDLHGHEFGKNNSRLVKMLVAISPDVLLMAGDMVDAESKTERTLLSLIRNLKKEGILTYYAYGNQEIEWEKTHGKESLKKKLEAAGIKVLNRNWEEVKIRGNSIRIGGINEYAFALDGENSTKKERMDGNVYDFLSAFQKTKNFTCMISHMPENFVLGDAIRTWKINLVVSGHDHGGQVVIPKIGGVYGGDQGWFPKYVKGYFSFPTLNMAITSGLGSGKEKIPRYNNTPEIMVIHIKCGKESKREEQHEKSKEASRMDSQNYFNYIFDHSNCIWRNVCMVDVYCKEERTGHCF